MLIAIDYDDTFTLAPQAWRAVIAVLRACGHEVIGATSRRNTAENRNEVEDGFPCAVVYCNHNAKAEHLKKLGIVPDVWIDDNPWSIVGEDHPSATKKPGEPG